MTILQTFAVFIALAETVWEFHPRASLGNSARWAAIITLTLAAFTGITWSLL